MNSLFLAWQDPDSRSWFPVGKLSRQDGIYHFHYLQGALRAKAEAGFMPIWSFPHFGHSYSSKELFPLFSNRLLRSSRPEYPDFIQWLNIPGDVHDPIALLARSGGKRKTDSFEVFPCPELGQDGSYHIHFFAHGLRYFPSEAQAYVRTLRPDMSLMLTHDIQNKFDSRALILRTEDLHFVGYCPRYLTQDFFELVSKFPQRVNVAVERINQPPTPLQFQLLCNLTAECSESFEPCSSPDYEAIPASVAL